MNYLPAYFNFSDYVIEPVLIPNQTAAVPPDLNEKPTGKGKVNVTSSDVCAYRWQRSINRLLFLAMRYNYT